MKPEMIERAVSAVPLRRMAEPAEMAHAAIFIAENDYFSGRVIEVDGGQTRPPDKKNNWIWR